MADHEVATRVSEAAMHSWALSGAGREHVWRLRRPSALGALAAGAVVLALLMAYGGGGHLLAVIGSRARQGRPYDFRFAALVTNGAILLYAGLTNLVLSR
jgi:hypothetical protein